MSNDGKTKIARVSEEAWQRVQEVATSVGDASPPVPLEKLATAQRIRRIRFEPLLSDAGLAKSGDDFEIVINTESPGVTPDMGDVVELGAGKLSDWGTGLRFTVAHEIAHAIFLQAAGGDSNSDLFQKNAQAVENACSILARVLLLPKQILVRQIGDRLFDINHVRNLLSIFQISPEVFIRRMHLSDMRREFGNVDGLLAFGQETDGAIGVRACHVVGYHALGRFNRALEGDKKRKTESRYRSLSRSYRQDEWVAEGQPLAKLRLGVDIESLLRNGETGQKQLQILWHPDEKDVIPCDLVFRRIHKQPLGFLVGIKVTGPKEKRTEKTLFLKMPQ